MPSYLFLNRQEAMCFNFNSMLSLKTYESIKSCKLILIAIGKCKIEQIAMVVNNKTVNSKEWIIEN